MKVKRELPQRIQNEITLKLNSGILPEKVETHLKSTLPKDEFELAQQYILSERIKDLRLEKAKELIVKSAIDELSKHYLVYVDIQGNSSLLEIRGVNTVSKCNEESCERFAMKYCLEFGIRLSSRDIIELVKSWRLSANPITSYPKSFSLNPNDLAFTHISIEIADGPCPVFDEFIGRCGANGKAVMAFIWSIFEESDKCQQYLLIQGQGRDGKGSLMRLLHRLVGTEAYTAVSNKDPHWLSKLVGKRVATWPDVNSTAFIMSGDFKAVTGGDQVLITEKFEKAYSQKLDVRIIISTNNSPEITNRKSDLRRCIFAKVEPNSNIIKNYEDTLWEERSAILFKCRDAYKSLYDETQNIIVTENEELINEADNYLVHYNYILDTFFELGSNLKIKRSDAWGIAKVHFKAPQDYSQFIDWLVKSHEISPQLSKGENGKPTKYLFGIGIKQSTR